MKHTAKKPCLIKKRDNKNLESLLICPDTTSFSCTIIQPAMELVKSLKFLLMLLKTCRKNRMKEKKLKVCVIIKTLNIA